MSLPTLTGVGRLIASPELRFTGSGKAVCKVRIAFNSRRKNPETQQWEDADSYFVDATVWGDEAERVAESLDTGHEVFVTGRLKTRSYETRDGEKRSATDLAVDAIGPTMRYANVRVEKLQRSGAQASGFDDPWVSQAPADDTPPF